MLRFEDRVVQHPNRVVLVPTGKANEYDIQRAEGNVINEGTPLNAVLLNKLREKIEPPAAGYPTRAYVAFNTRDGFLPITSGLDANSIVQRNYRGTFEIPTPQGGWDKHSVATKELFDILSSKLAAVFTTNPAYILGKACVAYGSRIIIRCRPSGSSGEYSYRYEDFALIWALKQDATHVRIAVAGVQNQKFGFYTHFLNESSPNLTWNTTVEATGVLLLPKA